MPEKPSGRPDEEPIEIGPEDFDILELEEETVTEKERIFEDVEFTEITKKKGKKEIRSSSPDRKIMFLKEGTPLPLPGRKHKVRIVEDTDPGKPKEGKYIVEIVMDEKEMAERMVNHAEEAQK